VSAEAVHSPARVEWHLYPPPTRPVDVLRKPMAADIAAVIESYLPLSVAPPEGNRIRHGQMVCLDGDPDL
jgi:hypothetical protein